MTDRDSNSSVPSGKNPRDSWIVLHRSCNGETLTVATGYEKSQRPTGIGFAGCASGRSLHHSTVLVTHRFL
jgi:hypothetical protein